MSGKKYKVVLDQPLDLHPAAVADLEKFSEVKIPTSFDPDELKTFFENADGLISWGNTKYSAEMIAQLPESIKVISIAGIGVDHIDLKAASKRGIAVCNTPGANANAVAEYTVGLLTASIRGMFASYEKMKLCHQWCNAEAHIGGELKDSTVGVVGLGHIGCRVATILKAGYGVNVWGFDPFVSQEKADKLCIVLTRDIEDMCSRVDYLCIHAPLTPATRNLIGKSCFERMKPSAWIVNAGRASVVDEDGLFEYLRDGKIAGYSTDVYPVEPCDFGHPIYGLENVVFTPHIATMTDVAYRDMQCFAVKNVQAILCGRVPFNRVV